MKTTDGRCKESFSKLPPVNSIAGWYSAMVTWSAFAIWRSNGFLAISLQREIQSLPSLQPKPNRSACKLEVKAKCLCALSTNAGRLTPGLADATMPAELITEYSSRLSSRLSRRRVKDSHCSVNIECYHVGSIDAGIVAIEATGQSVH